MPQWDYDLFDVFAEQAFGGNPLAVFRAADGMSAQTMQNIAGELRLQETTFVLPASQSGCDYQVRIFTPSTEMPTAGHPTLGTAFALARAEGAAEREYTFQQQVGAVPVAVSSASGMALAEMAVGKPKRGALHPRPAEVAAMLSVPQGALLEAWQPAAISCGVPYLVVGVEHQHLRSVVLDHDGWRRCTGDFETPHVAVFAPTADQDAAEVRMFAPALGMAEDPATGSAAGPVATALLGSGYIDDLSEIWLRQGASVGRPSRIRVRASSSGDGRVSELLVGGASRLVGHGSLYL